MPELTALQLLVPICTGLDLLTVEPSPNMPPVPNPQVNSNPSVRIAAVCETLSLTAIQLNGAVLEYKLVLAPQPHNVASSALIASVCVVPCAIAVQLVVLTCTGLLLLSVSPIPNINVALLPQANNILSALNAIDVPPLALT